MKPDERATYLLASAADDAVKTDDLAVIDVKRYVRTAGSAGPRLRATERGVDADGYGGLKARRSPDQELNQLLFGRFAR